MAKTSQIIMNKKSTGKSCSEKIQISKADYEELQLKAQILDLGADSIIVTNKSGDIVYANEIAHESRGYTREEFPNMNMTQIIPGLTAASIKQYHRQVDSLQATGPAIRESTDICKDGTPVFLEVHTRVIEHNGNKYYLNIARDITQRKKAETEQKALLEKLKEVNGMLEQSNQALQDFAYIASHDLREPLRKISSFGSLLQDSLAEKMDDDEKENLEFMIDGAQRMQTMIDDLLAYSRLTTKAKAAEVVDLNTIINNLKKFELAAQLDETYGIISIPHALPIVLAEESQMRQLFQNLIGNGLKYRKSDVKPVITISSDDTDNHTVRIEIQDNGIGIPEEYHKQIFVMFKRLHSRSRFEGNGIGLAICKKIVNRHGGDIDVVSKPGEGSTFRFTLPLP